MDVIPQAPSADWLTEEQIKDSLVKGVAIVLPPIVSGEPTGDEVRRTVRSEWLAALATQPDREIRVPIELSGVIVRGPLSHKYVNFFTDFSVTDSRFDSDVDLSFAVFHKVVRFEGTQFDGKVVLYGADVRADLELRSATFGNRLNGQCLVVRNALRAEGTTFNRSAFDGLKVEGDFLCSTANAAPSVFSGLTSFIGARIKGQAVFSSAQFLGRTRFDLIQIDGAAFFDVDEDDELEGPFPSVMFKDPVSFIGASIRMQLEFTAARFEKSVDFDGLFVTGDAHFENARFGVSPSASTPDSPIKIDFPGIRVTGEAKFEEAVFGGDVRFQQSVIEAEAFFGAAKFHGRVQFDGVRFLGPAFFTYRDGTRPAKFDGEVSFIGSFAEHDVHLERCTFAKGASFRDARFSVVYFREIVTDTVPEGEARQFPEMGKGRLDLRGFTYLRIYVAWKEMLGLLEPFDKQPYRLMESVLRTMGKETFAGEVYLEQRLRSLKYNWKHRDLWLKAIVESLYFGLFRFGVRPLRLFVITLTMLGVWACIFSLPHSVTPQNSSLHALTHDLTWTEALGFSFNTFMPFEVPIGYGWLPTDATAFHFPRCPVTFAFLATILRLMGWLFVPLGAAVFSGLLRRQQK